ncbi:MAG: thioredoxin domain-containing protein, partial [Bacillota bacterium]|nr:thioredoxin domain-containing protein [Bacillota bacterium]
MLYDNAFLAMAYLKAFQLTEKQQYATVAEEIFSFIKKDMTNKQGGFYSALDADINGEEGKFYIFSPREIIEVLGETDGQSFCQCYNITDQGNFEGASVPNRIGNHEPLPQNLVAIKEALYRYRNLRHRLHCDDKALTAWNGMMIAALADGYRILGKDEYLQQGENAFAFAEQHLTHDDGTLAVHWRKGKATGQGFLDDYCYMAYAAIALYRATLKLSYLEKASNLAETILNRFWDESNGGCFLYEETAQALILRPKEYYDGALPSGNSIFLSVLADLSAITGEYHWMEPAQKQAAFLKQQICSYPQISPMALSAAMTLIYPSRRAVFVTESPRECSTILAQSRTIRRPNTHIICKPECTDSAPEFLQKYQCIHGQTTCYLCDGSQCSAPTNDMDAVWSLLQ